MKNGRLRWFGTNSYILSSCSSKQFDVRFISEFDNVDYFFVLDYFFRTILSKSQTANVYGNLC